MGTTQITYLGKAVAMNNKKEGGLKYLSAVKAFSAYTGSFKTFLESCKQSDYSHEMWYGDKKVAKEMTKEQLENKFLFGLIYFNICGSNISNICFKHKDIIKRKDPQWP